MNFFNKNIILKKFNFLKKSVGGRNVSGKITVKHRALGHKKYYKIIDFLRFIRDIPYKVRRLEYDSNRNTYVALVCYKNSIISYLLAFEGVKINDYVISSSSSSVFMFNNGYSYSLMCGVIGSFIYNLEYFPNFGGKVARAAGTFCQILKKYNDNYILIKLKSKEHRIFYKTSFFSYGIVLNKYKKFEKLYKASQNIFRGYRPIVRGEAMNPVDHPHGGNTSGGRHPVSFTGKLTKGVKTTSFYKRSKNFVLQRKKKY